MAHTGRIHLPRLFLGGEKENGDVLVLDVGIPNNQKVALPINLVGKRDWQVVDMVRRRRRALSLSLLCVLVGVRSQFRGACGPKPVLNQ